MALKSLGFNPRTRGGCDGLRGNCPSLTGGFNPRTRGGCDLMTKFSLTVLKTFQSTHSRGVRPVMPPPTPADRYVSIHALAGGATHQT